MACRPGGRNSFPRGPVVAWLRELEEQGWSRQEIAWATRLHKRRIETFLNGSLTPTETGERVRLSTADLIACATGHHIWELEQLDEAAS